MQKMSFSGSRLTCDEKSAVERRHLLRRHHICRDGAESRKCISVWAIVIAHALMCLEAHPSSQLRVSSLRMKFYLKSLISQVFQKLHFSTLLYTEWYGGNPVEVYIYPVSLCTHGFIDGGRLFHRPIKVNFNRMFYLSFLLGVDFS